MGCVPLIALTTLAAAPKTHVVTFGKVITVKWFVGPEEREPRDLKVRPLYIDGKQKEFTVGPPHEITERLLVIRRAFRINDSLPSESLSMSQWRWQRGGWLMLDRTTGHITAIALPQFDNYFSATSWFRDYAAYCGVSDDGKKTYALVVQVGRRKPILRKVLGDMPDRSLPDSACSEPVWQRQPTRVTFTDGKEQKLTYAVRGSSIDVIDDDENDNSSE